MPAFALTPRQRFEIVKLLLSPKLQFGSAPDKVLDKVRIFNRTKLALRLNRPWDILARGKSVSARYLEAGAAASFELEAASYDWLASDVFPLIPNGYAAGVLGPIVEAIDALKAGAPMAVDAPPVDPAAEPWEVPDPDPTEKLEQTVRAAAAALERGPLTADGPEGKDILAAVQALDALEAAIKAATAARAP